MTTKMLILFIYNTYDYTRRVPWVAPGLRIGYSMLNTVGEIVTVSNLQFASALTPIRKLKPFFTPLAFSKIIARLHFLPVSFLTI